LCTSGISPRTAGQLGYEGIVPKRLGLRYISRRSRDWLKFKSPAARRDPMDDDVKVLERIYDRFNARDIDGVLIALTDDVAWANGMDGGHVHGREAVREYWTRQWTRVSPHVEPVGFHRTADGAIIAEVRQSVRDLEGKPLQGQTHGLKDKTVGHVFRLREGKVARFDIQDAP
jgi:ATP-dependent DNA ligase